MTPAATYATAESNARHARTIVQQLLVQGVRDAVVSPGSRNTPLVFALDAAARQGALTLHVVLDERVAGFVALGLARGAARPVALSCTSGSAGAHYLPAIMEAAHAGLCLIALTADRPEELQRRGAPQTTEQRAFFAGHVHETLSLAAPRTDGAQRSSAAENTTQVDTAQAAAAQVDTTQPDTTQTATAQTVERAIAGARAARAPLHINLALREPLWDAANRAIIDAPYTRTTPSIFAPALSPSPAGLEALAQLRGAGMFVVGPIDAGIASKAERGALTDALLRASQRLDWPIAADAVSPMRQQDLPTLKHLDVLLRDDTLRNEQPLDHVIVVGPWPTSKAFGLWIQKQSGVHVTSLPGHMDAIDPWHRVTTTVRGDLVSCIDALGTQRSSDETAAPEDTAPIETASKRTAPEDTAPTDTAPTDTARPQTPQSQTPRIDAAIARDRVIDNAIDTFCNAHPTFEGSIARSVVHTVRAPMTLHIASSMPIRDVDAYADGVSTDVRLCASRGVNGIDGNIATTLGEALASDTPAVLLMGDLAFRHDIGGLMHAANVDVSLTIVVIDNEGGGIFRHLAVSDSGAPFSPYFLTPQKTSIEALATGCGARVQQLNDATDLVAALRACMHSPGVDVLVVRTDGEVQVPWRNAAIAQSLNAVWDSVRDTTTSNTTSNTMPATPSDTVSSTTGETR